jgi:hypothetical protein
MSGEQGDGVAEQRVSRAGAVRLGVAGVAGALAGAAVSADTASAASGDPMVLGTTMDAGSSTTSVTSTTTNATLIASNTGTGGTAGTAVYAHAKDGVAVQAASDSGPQAVFATVAWAAGNTAVVGSTGASLTLMAGAIGVNGRTQDPNGAGVAAENEGAGNGLWAKNTSAVTDDTAAVYATNPGTGTAVYAESNGGACVLAKDQSVDTGAYGVYAQSSGGTGVYGDSTDGTGVWANTYDGTALLAQAQFGTAIDVQGRAQFNTSGVVTVKGTTATPKSSVRVNVTATTLTASSLVLATIQTNNAPGVVVQSAVPNVAGGYVTINLNQAVTKSVKVAWFVLN